MYAYEPYGPHTSDKWQIWAYSSAAPSFIGNNAAIIGASGEVIREGNNGWTCQSANPRPYPKKGWKNPHEAMAVCHDDEGMRACGGRPERLLPGVRRPVGSRTAERG